MLSFEETRSQHALVCQDDISLLFQIGSELVYSVEMCCENGLHDHYNPQVHRAHREAGFGCFHTNQV